VILKTGGLEKEGGRTDQFEACIEQLRQGPRDKPELALSANILGCGVDCL
jgi:hypothetical protein